MMSSLYFVFVLFFSTFAAAAPVEISAARDVFVPPVIFPNGNSVWKIGTTETVTWDVSHPPKRITNAKASIFLVNDGRIDLENPLATNLDVLNGWVDVLVPDVEPGKNYQILVMGDSGNTGKPFTIVA